MLPPGLTGDAAAVAPPPPVPAALAEQAENCLRRNSYVALQNISCTCDGGVLTLSGCVPSYYLKQVAQTAVCRLAGVGRVVNQLEVVAPNPRAPLAV